MNNPAMGEPKKRITRMRYHLGPMGFLSDQIRKEMQRAGYPPTEHCLYRPPEVQRRALNRGVSKARPFQSAHQYYAAADIVHERWFWFAKTKANGKPTGAPEGAPFWGCLWDCVSLVSEKFNVEFRDRITWDPAHVELANWRDLRAQIGRREPTACELEIYFQKTLPGVWAQHQRSQSRKV